MLANLENSVVATGLKKVSFHSNPKEGQCSIKNVQTTTQMHSFHMPARSCSKSSKLGFNSLITEKAREFQKNIYFCFTNYSKTFDRVDHNKLWKIFKEIGIPDHLTCLLRNLYAGQEETIRSTQGTTDWFQNGKGVHQGCILSPCLFNLYAEYIM